MINSMTGEVTRNLMNLNTTEVEVGFRRCKSCDKLKVLEAFGKNRGYKDGMHNQCKECVREYNNEWRRTSDAPSAVAQREGTYVHRGSVLEVKPTLVIDSNTEQAILEGCVSELAAKVQHEYRKRHNIDDAIAIDKWEVVESILAEWLGGDA